MDTFERNAARTLAVAYNAYMEALAAENDNGRRTWSRILLDAQRATGIELLSPDTLLYWLTGDMECVRRVMAQSRASITIEHVAPDPAAGDGPSKLGVISAAPVPRKPSPGAVNDLGARAAAYFAQTR